MPPSPTPAETEEQALLSDQDVGLLHQIVSRAQHHGDVDRLPLKAIYSAYEAVLADNGIKTDSDRVLLRFLLKLGEGGLQGTSLYNKFEQVLEKLGISLEFDDDNASEPDSSQELQRDQTRPLETDYESLAKAKPASKPKRRASFASLYDATTEIGRKTNRRASSRSSVSRLPIARSASLQGRSEARPRSNQVQEALRETRAGLATSGADIGGGLSGPATPRISPRKRQRDRSTSRTRRPQIRRSPGQKVRQGTEIIRRPAFTEHDADESDMSSRLSWSREGEGVPLQNPSAKPLYTLSEAQLIRDADTFNEVRLRGSMRGLLVKWAAHALELKTIHEGLEARGISKDATALKRQAFDLWHVALLQKRRFLQTERFYNHLHSRAAKAYDLYLLTKAFTHWKELASDEVLRTSLARRHLLRTKYFNAWRDITVINELKAQRLGLKKPYRLLKRKYVQALTDQHKAIAVYHENLTKFFYWRWFWTFCDRRAPGWGDGRLKQRTFISWIRALRSKTEREDEADMHFEQAVERDTLRTWSEAIRLMKLQQQQADAFRKMRMVQTCLKKWRVEARLAPIALRVGRMVEWRIARSTSSVWMLRTNMARKAQEVDNLRIKRNVWTTWNDRLRVQALASQIDERLVMQALYKWILAERFRLMRRLREQRSKRATLARLVDTYRKTRNDLLKREQQLASHGLKGLLVSSLGCWKLQMKLQRQRERTAFEFYAPRIEQESLEAWRSRLQHIQKTETWAKDAEFYFTTRKVIKQWHDAAVSSIKKRRHEAYAKVRRMVKMNLARGALRGWRERAQTIRQADVDAETKHQNKIVRISGDCFYRWRILTSTRLQTLRNADAQYRQDTKSQCLRLWLAAYRGVHDMDDKANRYYEIHVSELSATQLRKLSLRIFEIRRREQDADAITDRNQRKHLRNMFRHWLSKATISRGFIDNLEPSETGVETADLIDDTTRRVEDWTALEEDLDLAEWIPPLEEPQATSTPTPGYLNTPSKRAVRAKALASLSAMTPATPLRTPFATRLKSAYSTGLKPSTTRRGSPGRSLLSTARVSEEEKTAASP